MKEKEKNFKNINVWLHKVLPRRGTLEHSSNEYGKVLLFKGIVSGVLTV